MSRKHPWLCAGTAALALAFNQRVIQAEEPPQEEQVEIEVTESVQQAAEAAKAIAAQAAAKIAAEAAEHAQKAAEEVAREVTKAAGEAARQAKFTGTFTPGPYQIGLQVTPVSKALEAQLKLEGKGVLIDVVEQDSPGEKAGLKPHDIVITVAEQAVTSPADLLRTLTDSEGKELKFDVLRGGEKMTIMVQPRSAVKAAGTINLNFDMPKIEVDEEIIKLESKIREKLKDAGVDIRMQVIRPGQALAPDMMISQSAFPDGVLIAVQKDKGQPLEVRVQRGEEQWKVTEDSLDELPDDLRPHVERMLYRGPLGVGFPPNVKFTAPLPPGFVVSKVAPKSSERSDVVYTRVTPRPQDSEMKSILRRLDEIKKDIHRLYDQIDELREDRKKD